LTAFADILAVLGVLLTRARPPWLLLLPWIGVPLLLVGALETLRYPLALWLALLLALAMSLPLALHRRGALITGAALAAAATVTFIAQVRGTEEWGSVGFDRFVLACDLTLEAA
jgi:hypothetical protein